MLASSIRPPLVGSAFKNACDNGITYLLTKKDSGHLPAQPALYRHNPSLDSLCSAQILNRVHLLDFQLPESDQPFIMDPPNFRPGLLDRLLVAFFHFVNLFIPWHKLPSYLGALNLDALRVELRQYNLHDGYASATAQGNTDDTPLDDKRFLSARNSDGIDNSLTMPKMGCSGMRFGRNFPRKYCQKPTEQELWTPNPRLVSEAFMARRPGEFKPATTLNLLAAAWIQFQVHDWVFHESVRMSKRIYLMLQMLICVFRVRRHTMYLFSRMIPGMIIR
jgi:hypothetical protein